MNAERSRSPWSRRREVVAAHRRHHRDRIVAAVDRLAAKSADMPDFATVRARWQSSEAYLLDRHGVPIDSVRIDYGVRRFDWVPLDAVSTALIDAVVDGEDHRFWTHPGVDWRAALGALRDNLTRCSDAAAPAPSRCSWRR